MKSAGSGMRAFFWDETEGMQLLSDLVVDMHGWGRLRQAFSINDNGLIVGQGVNADGQFEAFLLTPTEVAPMAVPTPATLPLLTAGLSGLAFARRRRTRR